LPARYVPPSGFGYPLDGLLPANPCRLCFTPAALMGFTLRSVPLAEGIRAVSGRKHPRTVDFPIYHTPEGVGPARKTTVSGFCPFRESLTNGMCLAHRPLAAPLGFCLLGFLVEGLDRDFARSPLTRFSVAPHDAARGAPESREPSPPLVLPRRQAAWARVSDPFRLSAPARS